MKHYLHRIEKAKSIKGTLLCLLSLLLILPTQAAAFDWGGLVSDAKDLYEAGSSAYDSGKSTYDTVTGAVDTIDNAIDSIHDIGDLADAYSDISGGLDDLADITSSGLDILGELSGSGGLSDLTRDAFSLGNIGDVDLNGIDFGGLELSDFGIDDFGIDGTMLGGGGGLTDLGLDALDLGDLDVLGGSIIGAGSGGAGTIDLGGLGTVDLGDLGTVDLGGFGTVAVGDLGSIGWGPFNLGNLFTLAGFLSGFTATDDLGDVLWNVLEQLENLPGLFASFAYLFGLICMLFAILKTKEHVENPNQVPIWEPIKRFIAGGAFFALPIMTEAAKATIEGKGAFIQDPAYTGWAGSTAGGNGLDKMLVSLVSDIFRPTHGLVVVFAYLAGLVFLIIGISRLLKSEQDGPRGPGGFGTIMTFLVSGCFFSIDSLVTLFSNSMFTSYNRIATHAVLKIGTGDAVVNAHLLAVISGVLGFMILVGWISFLRGFFILRDVAEGNQQASFMAAVTHMVGGILAVNLGPLMNAVQSTLGLSAYGVAFS